MNLKNMVDQYVTERKLHLKDEVIRLKKDGIQPSLLIVSNNVDKDSPSAKYINAKRKLAIELGIEYIELDFQNSNAEKISDVIKTWNNACNGIIFQLPSGFCAADDQKIIDSIPYEANIDGFEQTDKKPLYSACTPMGIIDFINYYYFTLKNDTKGLNGKNVVLLGRGKTVGRPLIKMLIDNNCTLTVCHSRSKITDIMTALKNADIVISAIGIPEYFKHDELKNGALIIDAGITIVDGKQVGDFSHEGNLDNIDYTPWVGGVGRLTTISLMRNLVSACEYQDFMSHYH